MEKTLSKDQVRVILENAPKNTNKEGIVNALISQGYKLEGLDTAPDSGATGAPEKKPLFDFSGKGNTSINEIIKKRGSKISDIIDGTDQAAKGESAFVRGTQAAAQGAGAVLDVAGSVVGHLIPQDIKDAASGALKAFGDAIGFKAEPTQAFVDKVNEWADANPDQYKNVVSTLKAAGALGETAGAIAAVDGGIKSAEGIIDKTKQAATQVVDKTKAAVTDLASANATRIEQKALGQAIKDTMEVPNKDVLDAAKRNALPDSGGVKRKGILGKAEIQPTEEDIARAKEAQPYIANTKDRFAQVANINQGIVDKSKALDTFADTKAAPANFEDIHKYITDNLAPTSALKKDAAAFEAYNRASSSTSNIVADALREEAKITGDYSALTSTKPIRAARIKLDKMIEDEFGKATFGTPQYYGIKAAEINGRNMLNRLQEDMVRYPGQLENLNRYNEALDELRVRKIDITPENETALKEKFGLKSTPETEAAAQHIADEHAAMNRLYEARDNIFNRAKGFIGKNKVQEYLKEHPAARKAVQTVTSTLRLGAGVDLAGGL